MAEKSEKSSNPFENLDEPGPESSNSGAERAAWSSSAPAENPGSDPPPYFPSAAQEVPAYTASPNSQPPQNGNKIIAIPATDTPLDSPFLRAYPPTLQRHQLPQESFLSFLDELNKVIATSAPLQVLDATGGVLNAVPILFPLHWIGSTLSGIANLSSQGMSKSRAESAIRQANRDIFGPRGLKVGITGLDALAHMAKIPILDSRGKVNRQAPLFQQLLGQDGSQELDRSQRLVGILQPWIAALEVHVLPWTSGSKLTRFNAALKKRNNQADQDAESSRYAERRRHAELRREAGPRILVDSRRYAEPSSQAESIAQGEANGDKPELKKGLWLIISELNEGDRS